MSFQKNQWRNTPLPVVDPTFEKSGQAADAEETGKRLQAIEDELSKVVVIPTDYEDLDNKPSINNIQLKGNKSAADLGLAQVGADGKIIPSQAPDVAWEDISGKPTDFAPAAHTHKAKDIIDMPTHLSGDLSVDLKGVPNGLAELDENGQVPAAQLPSFVDDVLEYPSLQDFPVPGETGKIYTATDANRTYRWGGTRYVTLDPTLALGETDQTAYRGDKGKVAYEHSQSTHAPINAQKNVQSDWNATSGDAFIKNKPSLLALGNDAETAFRGDLGKAAYDHSQSAHARVDATRVSASSKNGYVDIDGADALVYEHPTGRNPHGVTKADVGLGNVGNFKAVSTVANQGLTEDEKANARANIGAGSGTGNGTVTSVSVKMNNDVKGTVTTSGTIDLGTVLISHQDISGKLDKTGGTITGHISRSSGGSWISGRDNAVVRQTSVSAISGSSWNPAISIKTATGNWTMGTVGGETLCLSYDTDANYNSGKNQSAVINFPAAGSSGTLALTSQIPTTLPANGGNADTLDGYHYNSFNSAVVTTQRDFVDGTLIKTCINYSERYGDAFFLTIRGNVYGRGYTCYTQIQGYIYDDTIINYGVCHLTPAHIAGSIIAMNIDGCLCFWFARQSYWEGYEVFCASAYNYRANTVTWTGNSVDPGGTKRVDLSAGDHNSYTITNRNIGNQSVNYATSAGSASSAGNADTVDGLHVHAARNNEANKIVRTDGNGFSQLYYINSNTINNENPSISQIIVTNGNDDYYRKASLAHLKSSLGSMPANGGTATNAEYVSNDSFYMRFHWSGQGGQPSWLWGGSDGTNMYVYNPSNFSVNSADHCNSLGNQGIISGRETWNRGLYTYNSYGANGAPSTYMSYVGFGNPLSGQAEIGVEWTGAAGLWYRSQGDLQNWTGWKQVIDTGNIGSQSVNYATSAGSLSSPTKTVSIGWSGVGVGKSFTVDVSGGYRIVYVNWRKNTNSAWTLCPIPVNAILSSAKEYALSDPDGYTCFNISISGNTVTFSLSRQSNSCYIDYVYLEK